MLFFSFLSEFLAGFLAVCLKTQPCISFKTCLHTFKIITQHCVPKLLCIVSCLLWYPPPLNRTDAAQDNHLAKSRARLSIWFAFALYFLIFRLSQWKLAFPHCHVFALLIFAWLTHNFEACHRIYKYLPTYVLSVTISKKLPSFYKDKRFLYRMFPFGNIPLQQRPQETFSWGLRTS